MPSLDAIWIKRFHKGPMDGVVRATLVAGRGLVGNADQGGRRQVTVMSNAGWASVTSPLGATTDPVVRRANLLVSDLDLANSRGKVLRVGTVRIRLVGETRPCDQMEQARPGLKAAMSVPWGGGAYGEVLDDGEIAVGDKVALEPD